MKKTLIPPLIIAIFIALVSCGDPNTAAPENDSVYIAIVSKGFQHQFWQTVYSGSKAAAADFGAPPAAPYHLNRAGRNIHQSRN